MPPAPRPRNRAFSPDQDTELPAVPYTRAHVNARTRDSALYAAVVCSAIGLGLFLHWPSLDSGYRSDDFPQRAMLRGEFAAPRAPLDLFSFVSGDPNDVARLMDFGYVPW